MTRSGNIYVMYKLIRISQNKVQYVAFDMCWLIDKLREVMLKNKVEFEKEEAPVKLPQLMSGTLKSPTNTIWV